MGVVYKGGQYQLIIGPTVTDVYDEVVSIIPQEENSEKQEIVEESKPKEKGIKRFLIM